MLNYVVKLLLSPISTFLKKVDILRLKINNSLCPIDVRSEQNDHKLDYGDAAGTRCRCISTTHNLC